MSMQCFFLVFFFGQGFAVWSKPECQKDNGLKLSKLRFGWLFSKTLTFPILTFWHFLPSFFFYEMKKVGSGCLGRFRIEECTKSFLYSLLWAINRDTLGGCHSITCSIQTGWSSNQASGLGQKVKTKHSPGRMNPCLHAVYAKFWPYRLNVAAEIETLQIKKPFFFFFFQSSTVEFWWILIFLFSADWRGTCCGLMAL